MLNTYIFTSCSKNGYDIITMQIEAEDYQKALAKAYEYFGETILKIEEFYMLCCHNGIDRICDIFTELTDQKILYFAERKEGYYVDDLYTIKS